MNNQVLNEVADMVTDISKTMAELVEQSFKGLTYGTRELRRDDDFIDWYLMKVSQRGPLWPEAISHFPEGKRIVERFQRLAIRRMFGTPEVSEMTNTYGGDA